MRNPVAVSIRFLRSFLSKKKEAKKKPRILPCFSPVSYLVNNFDNKTSWMFFFQDFISLVRLFFSVVFCFLFVVQSADSFFFSLFFHLYHMDPLFLKYCRVFACAFLYTSHSSPTLLSFDFSRFGHLFVSLYHLLTFLSFSVFLLPLQCAICRVRKCAPPSSFSHFVSIYYYYYYYFILEKVLVFLGGREGLVFFFSLFQIQN